ncbi:MAG: serine/threonine protein kinase [Deltaproteobacteria bacterium]|nr:serine/threonine protein kinase [Deltaproteobacteria bacterium]
MPLGAGDRVDRYELVSPLGEGGQADVWLARDPLSGEHRAIKLVGLRTATDQALERARREARALAALVHPSLCKCYGLFEDLDRGLLGFSMDSVEGSTLSAALDDPRLAAAHKQQLVAHLASALAHLHDHGLIHRDLKPDNILLTSSFWQEPAEPCNVRLVDLGIAALQDGSGPLTKPGCVIGTAPYMAPEQIEPSHWGTKGAVPATDVFALGVVIWKLFVGGHPTGLGDDASVGDFAVAYRQADQRLAWPPFAPDFALAGTMKRCIELRPTRRFPNGTALLESLAGTALLIAPARSIASTSETVGRDPPQPPEPPTIAEAPAAHMPPAISHKAAPGLTPTVVGSPPAPGAAPPFGRQRSRTSPGRAVSLTIAVLALVALGVVATAAVGWWWLSSSGRTASTSGPAPQGPEIVAPGPTGPVEVESPPREDRPGDYAHISVSYAARLSNDDHLGKTRRRFDHAFQVLQQDRFWQKRDPEDQQTPTLKSWPEVAVFAHSLGTRFDLTAEGRQILTGTPLVRVIIKGGDVDVKILRP